MNASRKEKGERLGGVRPAAHPAVRVAVHRRLPRHLRPRLPPAHVPPVLVRGACVGAEARLRRQLTQLQLRAAQWQQAAAASPPSPRPAPSPLPRTQGPPLHRPLLRPGPGRWRPPERPPPGLPFVRHRGPPLPHPVLQPPALPPRLVQAPRQPHVPAALPVPARHERRREATRVVKFLADWEFLRLYWRRRAGPRRASSRVSRFLRRAGSSRRCCVTASAGKAHVDFSLRLPPPGVHRRAGLLRVGPVHPVRLLGGRAPGVEAGTPPTTAKRHVYAPRGGLLPHGAPCPRPRPQPAPPTGPGSPRRGRRAAASAPTGTGGAAPAAGPPSSCRRGARRRGAPGTGGTRRPGAPAEGSGGGGGKGGRWGFSGTRQTGAAGSRRAARDAGRAPGARAAPC